MTQAVATRIGEGGFVRRRLGRWIGNALQGETQVCFAGGCRFFLRDGRWELPDGACDVGGPRRADDPMWLLELASGVSIVRVESGPRPAGAPELRLEGRIDLTAACRQAPRGISEQVLDPSGLRGAARKRWDEWVHDVPCRFWIEPGVGLRRFAHAMAPMSAADEALWNSTSLGPVDEALRLPREVMDTLGGRR